MNIDLPITAYRDEIVTAVQDHDVVIITAETGAGKSTQVPQYLLESGYSVVVTQPRRVAAFTVAQRVAEEMNSPLGETIGYRTAVNRQDSPQTKVLFCTDGLQLVRELTGRGTHQVLIIDEVHEWNRNIETLVAWVKRQRALGKLYKVVLMSATIEAEELSRYFDDAPVISVPGRIFPVEEQQGETSLPLEVAQLVQDGRNVLVFTHGKAEIQEIIQELQYMGLASLAEILPLHGELSPEEQRRVFRHYPLPKVIVSTNIAQTSVTIDDIDAVVDTGTEKRIETREGVEGLFINPISQADCKQRKGRAGRTKPGVYLLCSGIGLEDRPRFSVPEILRSRLDQLVLRLAEIGLDATELEFFHQPDNTTLVQAKEALTRLGALDQEGKITKIGRAMSKLPVDVHHARMIVEARERNVLQDIVTIVACIDAGGICRMGQRIRTSHGVIHELPRWHQLTRERSSDLLAELDCYHAALSMTTKQMRDHDINVKAFFKAKEVRQRLAREFNLPQPSAMRDDRKLVLLSVASGMVDYLYQSQHTGRFVGSDGDQRVIEKKSVVSGAQWVVGKPFDLEYQSKRDRGTMTLNLLTQVTRVDPSWLSEVAPQLVTHLPAGYDYSTGQNEVVKVTSVMFNGHTIDSMTSPAEECPEATRALAFALAKNLIDYPEKVPNQAIIEQAKEFYSWHPRLVTYPSVNGIAADFVARLGTIYRVTDLSSADLKLSITDYVPAGLLASRVTPEPEKVIVNGVELHVTYRLPPVGDAVATVRINERDVARVEYLAVLPGGHRISGAEIIDDTGEVILKAHNIIAARYELTKLEKQARKDAERQTYLDQTATLRGRIETLAAEGKETASVSNHLRQLVSDINAMGVYSWSPTAMHVQQSIRRLENEIVRLSEADPVSLLVDAIMAGSAAYLSHSANQRVRREVDEVVLRTNGFEGLFKRVTDEALREHYARVIKEEGVTRLSDLGRCNLLLSFHELIAEGWEELDLAPAQVSLTVKRNTRTYDVAYAYENVEGQEVATGSITIPLAAYIENCADIGKRSKFPALPYGIRLVIQVMDGDQEVARGTEEALVPSVKKYLKGKRNSRNTIPSGAHYS